MIGKTPLRWWKHFEIVVWVVVIAILMIAISTANAAEVNSSTKNGVENARVQSKLTPFQDKAAEPVLKGQAFIKQNPYKELVEIRVYVFNTGMPDAYTGALMVRGVGGGGKVLMHIPFR
jgi:hypothetical protein